MDSINELTQAPPARWPTGVSKVEVRIRTGLAWSADTFTIQDPEVYRFTVLMKSMGALEVTVHPVPGPCPHFEIHPDHDALTRSCQLPTHQGDQHQFGEWA